MSEDIELLYTADTVCINCSVITFVNHELVSYKRLLSQSMKTDGNDVHSADKVWLSTA
jgi:hypothetical protein